MAAITFVKLTGWKWEAEMIPAKGKDVKKLIILLAATFLISGCAGVSIKPISQNEAEKLHAGNNTAEGYVVHALVVVVEVSQKDVCLKKTIRENVSSLKYGALPENHLFFQITQNHIS